MRNEPDDYEVFLDTWKPGALLRYASLPSNLHDPFITEQLVEDSSGAADVARTPWAEGTKLMTPQEERARCYEFFELHQADWAADFRGRLLSEGISQAKYDKYVDCFCRLWIDGFANRQNSNDMMAIKASIRDHDRRYYPQAAGKFVMNEIPGSIAPYFDPAEMKLIFEVNSSLLEVHIGLYQDYLHGDGEGSINRQFVRRGVYMQSVDAVRRELHYLSSYSLALAPPEQFAQQYAMKNKGKGNPTVFSAPLPAIQSRVVAFAAHIPNMDLRQLELVVAPPIEEMALRDFGAHGGIHEYGFT